MPTEGLDLARLELMPIVDDAVIAALRDPDLGGDPEFLADVVAAFLDDTPPRIATIRASQEHGEAERLWGAAHCLKGSSGSFGAARMVALCAHLERLGRAGHVLTAQPLIESLEVEYRLVADRLGELVLEEDGIQDAPS
jgi:HPt (histidine-containing phosphotransfer) domain-containing protein